MEIPADILFCNILLRLPPKSTSRFKCVSKQWNSFLSTSTFHHKFLCFSSSKKPTAFQTLDCESLDRKGLTPARSLPFEVGAGRMTFITSFNGLVCVGAGMHGTYADMILWNPCTGDYKRLSKPEPNFRKSQCYQINGRAFGLYYSYFDDDYRLLRVTDRFNVYIYSLKSDSWRKLDYSLFNTIKTTTCNSETWGVSIVHNENIYFLKKRETFGKQFFSIIRFDTKTESFIELPTPPSGDDNYSTTCLNSILLDKDSKFYLCQISKVDSTELCAKLWRMDGDGDEDGAWMKVATYPIPRNFYCYEPLHLMRDGNWATLCRSGCHVYKLDPAGDFKWISNRIDNSPQGKYTETLVSPNRYKEVMHVDHITNLTRLVHLFRRSWS